MGKLLALFAALSYGANTTLSRLAYDTGTNPVSLTIYRYAMITAIFIGVMLVMRRTWRLRVSPRLYLGCVLGMYAISIGHLGAVNYIPVSLSAIIFYTYPLQVIAYRRWVSRQPTTWPEALGFVLAFTGLIIALGPEFHQMDWRGLVLAFIGAIGALVFLICYESFPDDTDPYAASAWIAFGTFGFCLLTMLAGIRLTPPIMEIGWVYLWIISALTVLAILLTVFAIKLIGAKGTALFLNIEPVIILGLAWIVLNESLSLGRLLGVVLVVVSLIISQIPSAKAKPSSSVNNQKP